MHDRSSQVRLTDHRVAVTVLLLTSGPGALSSSKVQSLNSIDGSMRTERLFQTTMCTSMCGMHIFSVMHIGYEWVFNLFYSRIILAICNIIKYNFIELLLINTVKCLMFYTFFHVTCTFMHFWLKIYNIHILYLM